MNSIIQIWAAISEVVRILNTVDQFKLAISTLTFRNLNKRMVNDSKVTGKNDGNNLKNIDLPEFKLGDELNQTSAAQRKKDQLSQLYNKTDLSSSMENTERLLEDKKEHKINSNVGVRTHPTRASINETLLSRNYIIRKNKALVPTGKGLKVYHLDKCKMIANVQMTAE